MSASSEAVAEATATLPGDVALHARPAGVVSREAMQFSARLTVVFGNREADARSVLRVMSLGAGAGATVTIRGEGDDAEAGVARLAELIAGLTD